MKRIGLFLLAVVMVAGCGGGDGTNGPGDCTGDVSLTVTAGKVPTFSWIPSCGADKFIVYGNPHETEVGTVWDVAWSIGYSGETAIFPSLVYGIVPPGADEIVDAQPLVRGTRYQAKVITLPGDYTFKENGVIEFIY